MANIKCSLCQRMFNENDEVKALILTRFKSLKSKVVYALGVPTECIELMHNDCGQPKGEHPGD